MVVYTAPRTKKIGGILFKRVDHNIKKGEAMDVAKYWRGHNWRARVVKVGKNYSVYLRKGRRGKIK